MTELTISPSQLKTIRDCPRKWYYDKVLKVPRPSSPAAEFGTRTHTIMEAYVEWLLGDANLYLSKPSDFWESESIRTALDLAKEVAVAKEMSKHLPTVHPDALIEPEMLTPPMAGIKVNGRIDLMEPHRITDWKTCGSFNYVPSEGELSSDPQKIIYSKFLLDQVGVPITYRHVYSITKGSPASRVVSLDVTPERNDEQYEKLGLTAAKTLDWRELPVDEVPFKLTGCSKYGGCPYRATCNAKEKSVQVNAFRAKLEAARKAKELKEAAAAQGVEVEGKSLAGVALAAKEAGVDLRPPEAPRRKKAKGPTFPNGDPVMTATKQTCFAYVGDTLGIGMVEAALLATGLKKKQVQEQVAKFIADEPNVFCSWTDVSYVVDPEEDFYAAGPVEKALVQHDKDVQTEQAALAVGAKTVGDELKSEKVVLRVLYINCAPTAYYERFEDLIAQFCDEVSEVEGVYWAALDYAKGPPLVAALLKTYLEYEHTCPKRLVIDTAHPAAQHCLPVLYKHYAHRVRGW